MYRSVGDVDYHHWVLKGVAEIELVKSTQSPKTTTVHWHKMSSVWILVPAAQRKEEVRTRGLIICDRQLTFWRTQGRGGGQYTDE